MEERVQKIIAASGICSRRAAEDLIEEGRVKVNGKTIQLGNKADVEKDDIFVDGKRIPKQIKVYLKLNKPPEVETTLAEVRHRTIAEYLPKNTRVYPVGRLDYDTEGLLLCTNDGELANLIMHPRYELEKTYEAYLDGPLTEEEEAQLKGRLVLDDGPVHGARIKILDEERRLVEITIHEGRNKIVKRMCKAVGHYVRKLKRVRIGPLTLGKLQRGKTIPLTKQEVALLRKALEEGKVRPKKAVTKTHRPRTEEKERRKRALERPKAPPEKGDGQEVKQTQPQGRGRKQ